MSIAQLADPRLEELEKRLRSLEGNKREFRDKCQIVATLPRPASITFLGYETQSHIARFEARLPKS